VSTTHIFTLLPERIPPREGGNGLFPPVHSDTLKGALRSVSLETGILEEAHREPVTPFSVSSVFLEVRGVRLYPRPRAEPAAFRNLARTEASFFRRIWSGFEFVTEARLESLAQGRRVRFEPEDIIEERAWGMPSERSLTGFPDRIVESGIQVDRKTGEVGRYSWSRAALSRRSRLFFLARFEDPYLLAPLKELVTRLGEVGLGRGRSRGAGHFSLAGAHLAPSFLAYEGEKEEESPPRPLILLSLYLPTRDEVDRGVLEGMSGDAILRGGWIHSGGPTAFRKRAVRMLMEGTVLSSVKGELEGEVRDVRPSGFERHPVWRDGRAFAIFYGGGQ